MLWADVHETRQRALRYSSAFFGPPAEAQQWQGSNMPFRPLPRFIFYFRCCYSSFMSLDQYELKSNPNSLSFEFYSEGPKGRIKKVIQFNKLNVAGETIYNLGFGDFNSKTEKIDDLVVSNNKDRDKILATVASSVLTFFEQYLVGVVVAASWENFCYGFRVSRYGV